MSSEISRKIIQLVRCQTCKRKNCKSDQRDPLDVVWFGKQYNQKQITCSACFICNDEAVKNAIPTQQNVVPLSIFIEQFTKQLKLYEQVKNSKEFYPKVLKQNGKALLADLNAFQNQLGETLKQLAAALVAFCKKVEQTNAKIFRHPVYEQIIALNSQNKLDQLLDKIVGLIALLNFGTDEAYHFQDVEARNKKLAKLKATIKDISERTINTLKGLSDAIREKNQLIGKI